MAQTGKYIIVQTAICCVINALFSFGFTYVAFHSTALIPQQDLIFDAMPQSFFVAFFAVFPATLLTRRRLAKGTIPALEYHRNMLPANAFLRAIVFGIAALIVGVSLHWLLLNALSIQEISFATALLYKTLYGIALTLLITPYALKCALAEFQPTPDATREHSA